MSHSCTNPDCSCDGFHPCAKADCVECAAHGWQPIPPGGECDLTSFEEIDPIMKKGRN